MTGIKKDAGKPRWDLLPMESINAVAEVLAFGAKKYSADNWRGGMDWGRMLASANRHLNAAWAAGVDFDEESGHHHLAHAACCVLMLLWYVQTNTGTDTRYRTPNQSKCKHPHLDKNLFRPGVYHCQQCDAEVSV
jgi:hypothetical protein